MQRDVGDEDEEDESNLNLGKVVSAKYPFEKQEGWWLVVGDSNSNTLLSVKRLTLEKSSKVHIFYKYFSKLGLFFKLPSPSL